MSLLHCIGKDGALLCSPLCEALIAALAEQGITADGAIVTLPRGILCYAAMCCAKSAGAAAYQERVYSAGLRCQRCVYKCQKQGLRV